MEKIGKYRIEEKIGSGGFGEVFRAYDLLIKRHVAIKTCGSRDPDVANRFFQEAEIGGNLHHRNITTVYDFGVSDGLPYLVQEYLSGEDLDLKIKRREYLPYTEKLLYLLQISRGLAYAHSQGVIHRDIKPANIRVLEDGTVKIMDFGIAKLAQQESGLTQTGMTLGTAAYLAPEQVRGDAVDLRTDIFSFGILAYELLTYERPFQGDQISTVLYNLLNHEPQPITAYWPGAPPQLVTLIDRCLRKDPDQRFADGNELVMELERLKKRGLAARPAATPAPATRPLAPPPVAPAVGASGLEYRLAPDRLPVATDLPVAGAGRSRRFSGGGLVTLLALAAAAAAAGWWLGMGGKPGDPDRPEPSKASATVASPAPEANLAETAGPEPAAPAQGGGEPTGMEPVTSSPAESPDQDPTQPAPPPAPATGKLILPRVPWTDQMSVRIGTTSYALDRQHTIELPPGAYRAVFQLGTENPPDGGQAGSYRPANRTVEVHSEAGQVSSVEVPIPPPGRLSVRPLPGRPQGQVWIDGVRLGPTPLSGLQREPGDYTLHILPREGEPGIEGEGEAGVEGEGEGLSADITLEAGQEVILSFDLDAGTVRTAVKALEAPGGERR